MHSVKQLCYLLSCICIRLVHDSFKKMIMVAFCGHISTHKSTLIHSLCILHNSLTLVFIPEKLHLDNHVYLLYTSDCYFAAIWTWMCNLRSWFLWCAEPYWTLETRPSKQNTNCTLNTLHCTWWNLTFVTSSWKNVIKKEKNIFCSAKQNRSATYVQCLP